jgi:sulfate adenylyltransferase
MVGTMRDHTTEKSTPHGGHLVNLVVEDGRMSILKEMAANLTDIVLDDDQLCDFELLATGVFSPIDGFMCRTDYESVLDRMRLQNDMLWPLPVCLGIPEVLAHQLEAGQSVALRDQEGFLLAVMDIEDLWPVDKAKEAQLLYGTTNRGHSGVNSLITKKVDYYVGGRLHVLSLPIHCDSKQLRCTPAEIRLTFQKLKWQRVVGFQTRNPIHRAQLEMTVRAMRKANANLLILPIQPIAKPDDFDHYTRIRCYKAITDHYPPDSFLLNLLPLWTRFAGPREALLHVIIAKNFGCTHFVIGRQHADPGADRQGRYFYGTNDAWQLVKKHSAELDVALLPFEEMVYLPFEDEYRATKDVPEGTQTIDFTGTEIRRRIRLGKKIPDWATFPEVVKELHKAFPPPSKQGFTLFLTGLSGAGKSTIAKILYSRFQEIGDRPVTLLDGDIVRRNLSSQLNFSKEHRDINVRRIGFVAGEITKNRGVAICAPIAPYSATRREIRSEIEKYGGFIEIHIATPIEVCEQRDRKGMYAKARAGLIKGFTGVDDPYEIPENPELRIDTSEMSPEESARQVLLVLGQRGYI